MKDYIKPTTARKPDMVILHTWTNDLKSNQNPSDIANEIISSANSIKIRGTEVSIHPSYLVEIDYLRKEKS